MEKVEGFTPDMLWTAIIVVLGLAAIWLVCFKVYESVKAIQRNRQLDKQGPREALADEISKRVLEKLEPRFADIDKKLTNDKATLEEHTQLINGQSKRLDNYEQGQKSLCRGTLALLNHAIHNGNTEELEAAQAVLNNYLIEK